MSEDPVILKEQEAHSCTLWLSRPHKRNAIDKSMAQGLIQHLDSLANDQRVKLVILRGQGKAFCAGADLGWMADHSLPPGDQADEVLPSLFHRLYSFPKPLVVMVHGHAMGGALGLMATGDFVLAHQESIFAFSELRLGLIPATITPFVLRRIGEYKTRQLMLRAGHIGTGEALAAGLVDKVGSEEEMEAYKDYLCAEIGKNAANATMACKDLIREVAGRDLNEEVFQLTARRLREVRNAEEAREGMRAFIEKRPPDWQHPM